MLDSLALSVSLGLQRGVPLAAFVEQLAVSRFEPAGWTERMGYSHAIVDYVYSWLALKFPGPGSVDQSAEAPDGETSRVCGCPVTWDPGAPVPPAATSRLRRRSRPLDGGPHPRHSDGMEVHPQSPPPMRGCALQWTPAEELEDGLEARLLLWHGRKIGLAFHSSRGGVPQTVLLGPVAEALGEPDGRLDGLDASAGCAQGTWWPRVRPRRSGPPL